jgi:hypothetical protein
VNGRNVTRVTRVPNFIASPDATFTDYQGIQRPQSAKLEDIYPAVDQMMQQFAEDTSDDTETIEYAMK